MLRVRPDRIAPSSQTALLVRASAPGRVDLSGEHTDYNDGWVLPIAIDRFCRIAATRRTDRVVRLRSRELGAAPDASLDDLAPRRDWTDYPLGVAAQLEGAGVRLPGADLSVESDVPPGSGLSSSAALEVATARTLLALAGAELEPAEIARLCQRCENEFVGARCGIMDPLASLCARAGQALLLDCRSLAVRHLPLPLGVRVVVVDSGVRHALAGGEYNERRAQCEEAVRLAARLRPGIGALRDLSPADLGPLQRILPEPLLRRCRHVVTENARVEAAAAALESGRADVVGELMSESHTSLARDYEVSCEEIDLLVRLARDVPGCLGARLTGGGFGGSTVNLVREDRVDAFAESVRAGYRREAGRDAAVYACRAADGAAAAAPAASQL